uniref:Uncharacterized protein n=1 Tax=viral metagenome TaxID=1070528 RepID=A0A6C0BS25_9ZZZZ
MNTTIKDALVGALMFGTMSYYSQKYINNPHYFKIVAFAWSAPFTYFYLLYITSRTSSKSVNDFNRHALIGILMTAFLIILYMYLKDTFHIDTLITSIFYLTAFFTFGYFYLKIFNKL